MVPINCKDGVRLKALTPALAWIFFVLDSIAQSGNSDIPDELVITSINDSSHMADSRHYKNEAIDLRSKNFASRGAKRIFRSTLEWHLNDHPMHNQRFRVLLENEGTANEHFHIQVARGKSFP